MADDTNSRIWISALNCGNAAVSSVNIWHVGPRALVPDGEHLLDLGVVSVLLHAACQRHRLRRVRLQARAELAPGVGRDPDLMSSAQAEPRALSDKALAKLAQL
jgi:hypothetical protein